MNGMYREALQDPSWKGVVIIVASIFLLTAHPDCARGQPDNTAPAAAGDAETAPRGQRVARDIRYNDWRKYCFKPAGTKPLCRTTITGTFETGQTAIRLDLIERDGDGGARLQLFLPVGMYLQAGVKLTVDQGDPYRIPYTWCLSNACIAADLADPKFIAEMERGRALALEVVDTNVLTVSTSLPLGSFASVRQGAATQTFDQNIDE